MAASQEQRDLDMQVEIEETGSLERRMRVSVPAERVDRRVNERLRELSKTVRLKGFRPGRVPLSVMQQRYGEQVRGEVRQSVIEESLQEAIRENSLEVAALNRVDPSEDSAEGDFEFSAEFEVFPTIGDFEVDGLVLERPVVDVTEPDVDAMIETLREQRRDWQDVQRPAASGDRVLVEYVATTGDRRVPAEGKQRVGCVIGSGTLFEAFEQALEGMEPGAEKSVELRFPDTWGDAQLAGANANVDLTMTRVQAGELPALDADFVRAFGIEDGDLDRFRVEVRKHLEREMRQACKRRLRRTVSAALQQQFGELELPEGLIQREAQGMQQRMHKEIEQAGGDTSQVADLDRLRPLARQRVFDTLLLRELARREDIHPDAQRIQAAIAEVASTFDDPQQVVELYNRDQSLYQQMQQQVLEEQVVEWLVENADTRDKPMSFNELMAGESNG